VDLAGSILKASFVFPYIGGWSDGVVLNSGDAYLDNFVVDSGCVTVIPAPGSIALGAIAVGLVGWLRRRRTL
jgi:MYXO-CTERM domain-containing protein